MASKTTLPRICAVCLLFASCTTAREKTAPAIAPARPIVTTTAPAKTAAKPKQAAVMTRPASQQPRSPATDASRAGLPGMIAGAAWTDPGRTMVVKRGGSQVQLPVPIFRQANVLASVRSALAGSSAQPQAEFRHGVLTLEFTHATDEEIANAVNKAISVSEARNVLVSLQP